MDGNKKPKLAIISSFNEYCGNATYAKTLQDGFGAHFDVDVLDLKTGSLLQLTDPHNDKLGDEHIEQLATQLRHYDLVNLHLEWGLYGGSLEQIERRLLKLISKSPNLLLTLHSLNISHPCWVPLIERVFNAIKSARIPYFFITHLPRERVFLQKFFGITRAVDYPVIYLTKRRREQYIRNADSREWKQRLGFNKNDKIIARVGFFAGHKDVITGLKALALLPPQYKLVFVGGEIPAGIRRFQIAPSVQEITSFLDHHDTTLALSRAKGEQVSLLSDRVAFLGNVSDDDLYRAVACSDIVTLTHRESGQSASGIASIAFELQRPMVLAFNYMFMEYAKYFPNCFEFFNIGNHYELRDKILQFDLQRVEQLKKIIDVYSLDGLLSIYQSILQDFRSGTQTTIATVKALHQPYNDHYYYAPEEDCITIIPSAGGTPSGGGNATDAEMAHLRNELNRIHNSRLWRLNQYLHRFRAVRWLKKMIRK